MKTGRRICQSGRILPGGHAGGQEHTFAKRPWKLPTCRHFACRRRDSNPRHADYDSARRDHGKRNCLQIGAFVKRGNTAEYPVSGSFRAYSGSIRGRFQVGCGELHVERVLDARERYEREPPAPSWFGRRRSRALAWSGDGRGAAAGASRVPVRARRRGRGRPGGCATSIWRWRWGEGGRGRVHVHDPRASGSSAQKDASPTTSEPAIAGVYPTASIVAPAAGGPSADPTPAAV